MLGMEIVPGTPFMELSGPELSDGVVSLIGLAGRWAGVGSISCSAELACRICSQFLMAEYERVDEEVLDSIGELTNMVIGNFKTAMEEILGPLGLSIPTVIFGHNFNTRSRSGGEWTVVPFTYDGLPFQVKVCFAPSADSPEVRPGFIAHSASVLA